MIQEATSPTHIATTPATEGIWSRRYRALTIGLVLTVAGGAFEALAVATTMPVATRELGGLALYGWAFSAFLLASLVGTVAAGIEADRSGPARPFAFGVGLFALGLIVAGLAPSMIVVVLGRAIQGLSSGAIGSVAYVAVGRVYAEDARPRMLAVLSSAWVVPGLVGPAIAGLIAEYIGWRWVFLGLAPLLPLAAMLALPALRSLNKSSSAERDWRRVRHALQLALGVGLALTGPTLDQLLLAALCVVGGVVIALPALRKLLPDGTLRAAPGLPAAIATACITGTVFFGVDAFVPLALTSLRGLSAALAGLALTAATVTWTTGAWLQAHYAAQHSRRRLVTIGLLVLAVGVALVIGTLWPGVPALLAPLAWGVAGLGMGLAYSTLSLSVLESAPEGQEGAATSSLQLANMLGPALGTGVGGAIIGSAASGSAPSAASIAMQFALMAALPLLGVWAARGLPGKTPANAAG